MSNMTEGETCRCQGRGVYLAAPEERGYHRALSLDRYMNVAIERKCTQWGGEWNHPEALVRTRLSAAYVNKRGDAYHFAANDPGWFGVRCWAHTPKWDAVVYRANGGII